MAFVSAIIPTWNRADLLRSILSNLRAQSRPPDEFVVIDNGSKDESCSIAAEFGAKIIAFDVNRGFATAVNQGIRQAEGDWILIINNDVVLQPNWLANLLSSAEQQQTSFAVGKLLWSGDVSRIDGSWDLISRAAYAWRCGYGKKDGDVWSSRRTVTFAPMTAALFRRSVFERVGLLETGFESYYEDVEFGVRCALAGLQGIYEPSAVATHMSKTTLGKSSYRVYFLTARNQVLLLAKHYPAATLRKFAWPILVGQFLSLVAAARQRNLWAAIRGKFDGLRRWSAFRPQSPFPYSREKIESTFCRSESEILELQKQTGFDSYWRLYFSVVRPG